MCDQQRLQSHCSDAQAKLSEHLLFPYAIFFSIDMLSLKNSCGGIADSEFIAISILFLVHLCEAKESSCYTPGIVVQVPKCAFKDILNKNFWLQDFIMIC